MTYTETHRKVAFAVARTAIGELRDTGAMDMSEIADDQLQVHLSDDDYDPISEAISDIADLLDAYLTDQEQGSATLARETGEVLG